MNIKIKIAQLCDQQFANLESGFEERKKSREENEYRLSAEKAKNVW